MNRRCLIAAALIAASSFTGGLLLGRIRAESQRAETLDRELESLRNLTAAQGRLVDRAAGINTDRLDEMDPITRRHLIQVIWYGDQDAGNYFIGREIGHRWRPVWNRRSPLSILEEQTEVMRAFLAETRRLEEESPHPPRHPMETDTDPRDGSSVDWEDYIKPKNYPDGNLIWFGKSKKSGEWVAFEYGRGAFEPGPDLLGRIVESRRLREERENDPFAPMDSPSDGSAE